MKSYFSLIPIVFLTTSLFAIQQSFAEETLDFETCEGFLSVDEVKSTIGYDGQITQEARGVTPVDEPFGLKTMCGSTFESADGTIGMTLVVMDSVDPAIELYVENRNSITAQDFEVREYLTFWNNFDVVLNDQGLGSLMVSQYDKFFLRFRTGIDEDKQAIADVEQLRVLSTIVQKKILDLPDVPISPPNPIPDIDEGPTTDEPPPKPGPAPIEMGEILSPKKQVAQGIAQEHVICKEELQLIIKYNGSPACVKPETAVKLAERGWGGPPPPIVSHGGEAVDYVSLIDNLRANATVNPEGEIEQPFFSVTGFSIQVNGASVQVFEYNTAEDAEADASLVSPDGSSIGTTMPFWVDDPHFYYKEKIIVLYVGDDPAIEELLESVLGSQFAGR